MAYGDSRNIANWFIRRAKRDGGRTLTNMQLQKLVYFAHGWQLALHKHPLVREEVEAWEFGPVIPELYRSLMRWGADPVRQEIPGAPPEVLEPDAENVLEQIYEAYAHYPASVLSALTHRSGTPWAKVFNPGKRGLVINNDIIADHFGELATKLD
jgi:uncharacterized phage-associated protein